MILKALVAVLIFVSGLCVYLYFSNSYYKSENETLTLNNKTLKANIITQQSKCEEDIAIEKANVKIQTKVKEVIKYRIKYIKEGKNEEATNDKFMLDTGTIK